jgi:hypothetical protein
MLKLENVQGLGSVQVGIPSLLMCSSHMHHLCPAMVYVLLVGIYDFAKIRNVTNSHMNKIGNPGTKTSLLLKPMVTWGSSILRNCHFC